MKRDSVFRRLSLTGVFVSLALLLNLPMGFPPSGGLPDAVAAPSDVLLVDHDGDASGEPCTPGTDGDCSLRSAIEQANSGAGADTIIFESGGMTIVLGSPLPTLTDDDTTIGPLETDQVIQVDANGVNGNVFEITGDDATLAYLRIYGAGAGWANVWIHGSAQGATISNNVIGDDTAAPGGCGDSEASHSGIFISSSGSTPSGARAWVYGNAIQCNGRFDGEEGHGIVVDGADEVVIGEDASGEATPAERNDIAENAGHGVLIQNGASGNVVRNSVIASNEGSGVVVESESSHNTIGGSVGVRNVIGGNGEHGILISGADTDGNVVTGNYIGTDSAGAIAVPNGASGVTVSSGASHTVIGSDSDFSGRNLISGNALSGVGVLGTATTDTRIDGNAIGTDAGRTSPLPNGTEGVAIAGASGTTVGSGGAAFDQVIAYNGGAGVFDWNTEGTEVGLSTVIHHNQGAGIAVVGGTSGSDLAPGAVHNNGGLPIDLDNDGHTPNDPGDVDSGPNGLLNYPRITSSSGSTITGTACADCHVRIYEAVLNPAMPGGGGELVTVINADGAGNWGASLPFGLTAADVSLVARDLSENTSEMSPRGQTFLPTVLQAVP